MPRYNAENERLKHDYRAHMREALGRSEATLDAAAAAIDRFQEHTGRKPFKRFRREQAISFKRYLAEQKNAATGKPLSKQTLYATAKGLRAFFEWLSREPGYRQSVHFSDASYFNVSENDARIATAARERPAPSLDQVLRVIDAMAATTPIERRDRAIVAFTLLTGARDSAVITARLKHLDLAKGRFLQDAREVKTKRAKTFTTVFFPVGEEPSRIVIDWIEELRRDHSFGPDDPLFPAPRMGLDDNCHFAPLGLTRDPWASTAAVRGIFRRGFEAVGLPYFNPHSIRKTLMRLGYDLELTPREMKAWSLGFGHESVLTSFGSYGGLTLDEQAATMRAITLRHAAGEDDAEALLSRLSAAIAKRRA